MADIITNIEFFKRLMAEDKISQSQKDELLSLFTNSLKDEFRDKEFYLKTMPLEPKPKDVAEFMSLFNQREGLKYLTHDYDEESAFDIQELLSSAEKKFKDKTNELSIPKSLYTIVNQFAFETEQIDWTSISEDYRNDKKVKIGWGTEELQEWSKQNNLHPFQNNKYKEMISDFKRITRIERSSLEELVKSAIHKNDLGTFSIELKDLKKADFYSHVKNLKVALETIFEEIKKYSDTPKKKNISVKYDRTLSEDGYHLRKIIITHYNSFPDKVLKLLLTEWQEKGNMGKIKSKLKGYCHWSVETLIEGSSKRVNILKNIDMPQYESLESQPEGFIHTLTFYYK